MFPIQWEAREEEEQSERKALGRALVIKPQDLDSPAATKELWSGFKRNGDKIRPVF